MQRPWSSLLGTKRKKVVAIVVGIVVAVVILPLYAFMRTPSWYAPPDIAPNKRQIVRNNLLAAQQAFTETLRTHVGVFEYHLHQRDINRWIAMRREIYPLIDEMMPVDFTDPFVVFEEDSITLAVRYMGGTVDLIVSMDMAVVFERESLILRTTGLQCGSIPVPLSFGSLGLDQSIEAATDDVWPGSPPMSGHLSEGLHIGATARWANGGLDYRVLGVRVEPGCLTLKVESLISHDGRARNDQD